MKVTENLQDVYLKPKRKSKNSDCLSIIIQFIKKNPTRCNNVSTFFIIPYLYKAQHVSGDTPPIIRSLKLQWQPLVFHTWKVVGRVVAGRCQAVYEKVHLQYLHGDSR
jgi:hypothetical protein